MMCALCSTRFNAPLGRVGVRIRMSGPYLKWRYDEDKTLCNYVMRSSKIHVPCLFIPSFQYAYDNFLISSVRASAWLCESADVSC